MFPSVWRTQASTVSLWSLALRTSSTASKRPCGGRGILPQKGGAGRPRQPGPRAPRRAAGGWAPSAAWGLLRARDERMRGGSPRRERGGWGTDPGATRSVFAGARGSPARRSLGVPAPKEASSWRGRRGWSWRAESPCSRAPSCPARPPATPSASGSRRSGSSPAGHAPPCLLPGSPAPVVAALGP